MMFFLFRFYRLTLFVFCLLSLVVGRGAAEQAQVDRVIDGDTVILSDGTRVRLIGINAPEIENRDFGHRGEPYGEEAKQVLKRMVEGKEVDLQDGPEKKDKYDRRLAYIYLANHFFVNQNLVEVGAAEAYRRFPHEFQGEFIRIEGEAKQKKLGMWAIEKKKLSGWQRLWGKRK